MLRLALVVSANVCFTSHELCFTTSHICAVGVDVPFVERLMHMCDIFYVCVYFSSGGTVHTVPPDDEQISA
jgi:hypothetical protein